MSSGRRVSILFESRIIPKNGREVAGPSTFSIARGTPSSLHVLVMMFKFVLQVSEVGGPMVKNNLSSEGGRWLPASK